MCVGFTFGVYVVGRSFQRESTSERTTGGGVTSG